MPKKEDWRNSMKTRRHKIYYMIMALLLTLCLLSGCINQPRTVEESGTAAETTEKAEEYETYEQDALKVQETFDQLTEDIFQENVSESLLNLHYRSGQPGNYGIQFRFWRFFSGLYEGRSAGHQKHPGRTGRL